MCQFPEFDPEIDYKPGENSEGHEGPHKEKVCHQCALCNVVAEDHLSVLLFSGEVYDIRELNL